MPGKRRARYGRTRRAAISATSRSPSRTWPVPARRRSPSTAVPLDKRHRLCRRRCGRDPAPVADDEAAPRRPSSMVTVYETLERPLIGRVIARMEAARNPRSTGNMLSPALRRFLADPRARVEEEIGKRIAGERFQVGVAEADRRHPVRQDGTARREARRKSGAVGDAGADPAGGTGPGRATRIAEEDPRMAPARQAEIHLYGFAAAAMPIRETGPGPHLVLAWQPPPPAGSPPRSRTCRTSRSAPRRAGKHPHVPSWRRRGQEAASRPITARSSCASSPTSPDIPQLRQAFEDGVDIHAMPPRQRHVRRAVRRTWTSDLVRRRAKTINFGIIYGISAFGLAEPASASAARRRAPTSASTSSASRHPRLTWTRPAPSCGANGFVTTLFGRKAHYPEIDSPNPSMRAFLERAAINAPSRAPPPTSSAAPWSAWTARWRRPAFRP